MGLEDKEQGFYGQMNKVATGGVAAWQQEQKTENPLPFPKELTASQAATGGASKASMASEKPAGKPSGQTAGQPAANQGAKQGQEKTISVVNYITNQFSIGDKEKLPHEIAQAAIQLERDFARLMKNYLAAEARRAY